MPDSLEAVFVLLILLPGCFGYFAFSRIYNKKIDDNINKIIYIALFNVLSLLILALFKRVIVFEAANISQINARDIEGLIYGNLFLLSLIAFALGVVAALIGNWSGLQSLLTERGLTKRSQHPAVLAAVIAAHQDCYMRFRFKTGGYIVGCPRLYSLQGEEAVIFLGKAAYRGVKPDSAGKLTQHSVDGPGIMLLNFDDVKFVEVLNGEDAN